MIASTLNIFCFLFLVFDLWGENRRAIDMERLDIILDYASRMAKPREPLADEEAITSEQVVNVAPEIVEAPTTEAVEKDATEVEVIEKKATEEPVIKKDAAEKKVGEARQSKRSSDNKAAETKSSQSARLNEAQDKGKTSHSLKIKRGERRSM